MTGVLSGRDGLAATPIQTDADGRLIVRGEDQLFTFKGVLALRKIGVITGAGGYFDSAPVPAGEIWVVTTVVVTDATTPTTQINVVTFHDGSDVELHSELRAFAAGDRIAWSGHTYLDESDLIRVYFIGSAALDAIYLFITGYRMTVET